MNWTPERQCASGGVAQVVLAREISGVVVTRGALVDQNADKMNLHDAHWFL